jgi:phosphoadenosine phosphosulfate reductase
MQRALRELEARAWITGLRRQQARSREGLGVLALQNGVMKVQPIIDWTDREVYQYLMKHDLPYHPLWEQGYLSIGDTHTSRPVSEGVSEEDSRFFGLKRECGLHENGPADGGKS